MQSLGKFLVIVKKMYLTFFFYYYSNRREDELSTPMTVGKKEIKNYVLSFSFSLFNKTGKATVDKLSSLSKKQIKVTENIL